MFEISLIGRLTKGSSQLSSCKSNNLIYWAQQSDSVIILKCLFFSLVQIFIFHFPIGWKRRGLSSVSSLVTSLYNQDLNQVHLIFRYVLALILAGQLLYSKLDRFALNSIGSLYLLKSPAVKKVWRNWIHVLLCTKKHTWIKQTSSQKPNIAANLSTPSLSRSLVFNNFGIGWCLDASSFGPGYLDSSFSAA